MSEPGRDGRWIVGVDLGGTSINVGVVSFDGEVLLGTRSLPTEADRGADFVVDRITEMVQEALRRADEEAGVGGDRVLGVGIGSPGPLNRESGKVLSTPNLGWRDFPLRERVARAVDLPASLDNDANTAALGEWWMGAGQGARHLLTLTLGTGIGGGIVIDGEVYHGATDVAGEVGHMTIDATGRKCSCGNYGCLEAYASGPAIAQRAVEGLERGADSGLAELVNGDLERITAETVYEAIVSGDRYAARVMRETARFLGTGLASLVNVLNPEVAVICGGVTRAGEHLMEPLREEVRGRAFAAAADRCRVVTGELGEAAGVVGAAAAFKLERHGEV